MSKVLLPEPTKPHLVARAGVYVPFGAWRISVSYASSKKYCCGSEEPPRPGFRLLGAMAEATVRTSVFWAFAVPDEALFPPPHAVVRNASAAAPAVKVRGRRECVI